jgi:hypothetical protein
MMSGDGQRVEVDQEVLRRLWLQLLDDEHGISEAAWTTMTEIWASFAQPSRAQARFSVIAREVETTEGRCYIPEGRAALLCKRFGWKDLDITPESDTVQK